MLKFLLLFAMSSPLIGKDAANVKKKNLSGNKILSEISQISLPKLVEIETAQELKKLKPETKIGIIPEHSSLGKKITKKLKSLKAKVDQ